VAASVFPMAAAGFSASATQIVLCLSRLPFGNRSAASLIVGAEIPHRGHRRAIIDRRRRPPITGAPPTYMGKQISGPSARSTTAGAKSSRQRSIPLFRSEHRIVSQRHQRGRCACAGGDGARFYCPAGQADLFSIPGSFRRSRRGFTAVRCNCVQNSTAPIASPMKPDITSKSLLGILPARGRGCSTGRQQCGSQCATGEGRSQRIACRASWVNREEKKRSGPS